MRWCWCGGVDGGREQEVNVGVGTVANTTWPLKVLSLIRAALSGRD